MAEAAASSGTAFETSASGEIGARFRLGLAEWLFLAPALFFFFMATGLFFMATGLLSGLFMMAQVLGRLPKRGAG